MSEFLHEKFYGVWRKCERQIIKFGSQTGLYIVVIGWDKEMESKIKEM
jgi:hypothetical protein